MKNIILLMLISAMSAGFTACVTKQNPAHTEIYMPSGGVVDYHCPPGQRKKERC